MRLKQLIKEITATELAHQKGYKSRAYGYWEKDGKIVARTVNGELVPVNTNVPNVPDASLNTSNQATQQTQSPEYKNGQRQAKPIRPSDIQKKIGLLTKKKQGSKKEETEEEIPSAPVNPYYKPIFSPNIQDEINKLGYGFEVEIIPLEQYDAKKSLMEMARQGPYSINELDDIFSISIPNEQIVFLNNDKKTLTDYLKFKDDDNTVDNIRLNHECQELYKNIKYKYDRQYEFDFIDELINPWARGHRRNDPETRERVNYIANIIGQEDQPVIHSSHPIYRGMCRKTDKIKLFLDDIKIGKTYHFPPSGFSLNIKEADNFSPTSSEFYTSVLCRINPNKNGEIHCLPIFPNTQNADYEHEKEVIKYSLVPTKCVGITKLIYLYKNWFNNIREFKQIYIIDFEEGELENEQMTENKKSIKEDINKPEEHPLFDELMNTPLRQDVPKKDINYKDFYREYIHGAQK